MESSGQAGFRRRVKERLKHPFKSPESKLQDTSAPKNICDMQCTLHQKFEHENQVKTVVFSLDGHLVASGSWDNTVCLWNTITGTQKRLKHHRNPNTVVFSPDGHLPASSSNDKTIYLWDTVTGTQQQRLKGHKGTVQEVVFSPDGRLLASCSDDKIVRLWDTVTGTVQQKLEGHRFSVSAVAFSPDGRLVASGSHGDVVRLWDIATGSLKQIMHFKNTIYSLKSSEDGFYLHSNRGSIPINSPLDLPIHMSTSRHNQVSKEGEWIVMDGENVL
ncbi:uncharacterized protein N7483_004204 [Penicillium malachiteum]|uniref:uncharacterized protein n=1 Tax=Penicillium malachiteum TaxID=1324776 RepID=UPI002547CCE3|nr:uncharacterized protein N7483_004204 [Penicillium malachiteum]KAJ5729696.1 hypothetical protein N7483_004204 [Penicillium malachiteum]